MTSRVLWNYHRDETNDDANENENDYRVNKKKATTSKPFECKTKIWRASVGGILTWVTWLAC